MLQVLAVEAAFILLLGKHGETKVFKMFPRFPPLCFLLRQSCLAAAAVTTAWSILYLQADENRLFLGDPKHVLLNTRALDFCRVFIIIL